MTWSEFTGRTQMTHWDDALGDEIKAVEADWCNRAAERGDAVYVRVDGAGFSRFTAQMERPFDARVHEAMVAATARVVEAFNCKVGYTQSDEASFVIYAGEADLPHGGRLQKIATRVASMFGAQFLLTGLDLFPEAIERMLPTFDGRALPCDPDMAARMVVWREIDARRNAVSMAARALFPHSQLQGKSSVTMKAMMEEAGSPMSDFPEAFRRGSYVRRVVEERHLTDEELARIPEGRRPTGPVARSRVATVPDLPPMSIVRNVREVLIEGALALVPERPGFAGTVTP